MITTSLRLKKSIDPETQAILRDAHTACSTRGVEFVLIGAKARDLILHHVYGAPVQRATFDVDIALQVSDWPAFQAVRDALIAQGYSATATEHRLVHEPGGYIDIIPFGEIANEEGHIA
ncbi:hypothetical protein [Larsenimonas rhizosphaerae]|uniref:Nucleotidyltransferase n=1 Tax=Larsenimonas rhizosphaerae TaxID=2944682 RepID=A0AA41ZI93_9GAMM|nr:hypothetical protein [Larsenimonas rhizosphaerae]MCX2525196.1 hypothetical protein [Larsenimonas rhizosphaerae]